MVLRPSSPAICHGSRACLSSPGNTAFTYKGKPTNVQDVGRELGVRYVLEGSVQKGGQQVRVVAQLVDTTTGGQLWSERYDRPLQDIFAVQDEIVRSIVTTLGLRLTLAEQGAVVRKATDNLDAYDAYLRGASYWFRFAEEANNEARLWYEKAIELDPHYADAYAGLSSVSYLDHLYRWNSDAQALERAMKMARKAVAVDDSLPLAHSLLSLAYAQQKQYKQALAEGERAIALDPNNAASYNAQAEVLSFSGRPEEALRSMEQAMRLNPHYPPMYLFEVGWASQYTGQYAKAIAALKTAVLRNPDMLAAHFRLATSYVWQWAFQLSSDPQTLALAFAAGQRAVSLGNALSLVHRALGGVYLWQKQYDQALAEMKRAVSLDLDEAWSQAGLAEVLSRVGRSDEAQEAADEALRRKPHTIDNHLYSVGIAYALAGQPDKAVPPLRQFLSRYPNILGAHLSLAAAYSEGGQAAEARAAATEVLRLNPQFSLKVHKQRVPIKDPTALERQMTALRNAGLE